MSARHGIYVTETGATVSTPVGTTSGIPFAIGTAPLGEGTTATAGVPVLCRSYSEAVAALGYSDTWSDYTLCEVMYCHFKLYNAQPVIFLPLASGSDASAVAAAVQHVDLCATTFGIVPDIIIAPGFSGTASVASAMTAKANVINGMFKAKAIIDVTADTISAAVTAKNALTLNSNAIACWPCVKDGAGKTIHMSTVCAGRMAATDSDNGGIPSNSPSNKALNASSVCKANGTDILFTLAEASTLNEAGIVTAINFMGNIVLWGNYTAGYPTSTDVKDKFIPVSRMFAYVSNTLIQSFWSYLDQPMTRRLADSIVDTASVWLSGLVGSGNLLGARIEMKSEENPVENLMSGIVKLHVYITPPSPAQEIDFAVEYDAAYVTEAFA